MVKEYIYVLTNPIHNVELVKVGRSNSPKDRVKTLSNGQPSKHVLEWYMEVPDSHAAEKIAHMVLKPYKYKNEYFKIGFNEAIAIIKEKVCHALDLNQPVCFEGRKLRALNRKATAATLQTGSVVPEKTKKNLGKQTAKEQKAIPVATTAPVQMSQIDRLNQFVHQAHTKWRKANRSLAGLFSKQVGDEGEDYIKRMLETKHGYLVVLTPASQTPVDVIGLKWCGYFWHLIMIQVKTSTVKAAYELSDEETEAIRAFGRFVREEYLSSELYSEYASKPITFSVGLANVKNYRPAQPRCTLSSAYFINWYWSKLPREKLARIQELVEEAHTLK